ncbi:hypothetical protein MRX96_034794 [Rhipicephalus microplus]
MGIVDQVPHYQEHEEVHKAFDSSIKFIIGRYEVALPWRPMDFHLTDNKAVAKKRLASLTMKLLKDEAMLKKYDEAIRQYLEQELAERLPKNAAAPVGSCDKAVVIGHHPTMVQVPPGSGAVPTLCFTTVASPYLLGIPSTRHDGSGQHGSRQQRLQWLSHGLLSQSLMRSSKYHLVKRPRQDQTALPCPLAPRRPYPEI